MTQVVEEEHPDNSNVWIDMESGVRTDDFLDLEKVHFVLNTCKKYLVDSK